MTQELREEVFKFAIGEKIEIDNMKFTIQYLQLNLETGIDSPFSVIVWGIKPNATTISKSRFLRIDNLIWKVREIYVFTSKGQQFNILSEEDTLKKFTEQQYAENDKIVNILVEMDTMLNEGIMHYDFDKIDKIKSFNGEKAPSDF